ncbi:extensin [Sciurus carolinensis]|uniref:extensin n=1 Tax=Sciurus carolinensis TaxID=30640 RepID=UPI001FB55B08|nr:extensin [Sciurus carolinensis]
MSSPSHTPNPSPTQSPSQSRSNHTVLPSNQQPYPVSGGSVPPASPTRGSSRPPSHPATPTTSQPSSRTSSLTPSPHIQHVARTPPASKSPSQSGLKSLSRNPSLTPAVPLVKSPFQSPVPSASYIGPIRNIPSYIAPYVPRFLREAPFFQPPTSPLPQNQCFPCTFPCSKAREPPPMPDSFYLPLLPPPPHQPQTSCTYPTPPALFTPPCSLSYSPPTEVLLSGKPHVVPSVLPATFYTPFSRYYSQPRPYRAHRRLPSTTLFPSLSPLNFDGSGRSVHFYRGS